MNEYVWILRDSSSMTYVYGNPSAAYIDARRMSLDPDKVVERVRVDHVPQVEE